MNRYGQIRLAHVHERVLTTSFVVLIVGNSKSFHLGAQGTFKKNSGPENNKTVALDGFTAVVAMMCVELLIL